MPKIALRTQNGQFLCAEGGGGNELVANRDWIQEWETMELIYVAKNKIALKVHNGMYVCAEGGGGREVVANRTHIQSWETFTILDRGVNKVALQVHNGRFVVAVNGGNGTVRADSTSPFGAATFEICDIEDNRISVIGLMANNGQYVCAEGGGGREVVANRNWLDVWETFYMIHLGGNQVALRAHNDQYICAEGSGGREVVANRNQLGPWETFRLHDLGHNNIGLQANNGQFVCAEGSGGRELVANRDWLGPWETFSLKTAAVSGLYRNSNRSDEVEELRLDVDGKHPTQRASGKIFLSSTQTVWWVAQLNLTGTDTWQGSIFYKHGASSSFTYNTVSIRVTRGLKTTAQVTYKDALGSQRVRNFDYRTPYFQEVQFEFDSVQGTTPVTQIDLGAHPNRPQGLSGNLSIAKAFENAGMRVTMTGGNNKVPLNLAGTNGTWSNAEMHDAMQKYWSRYSDREQWSMWVFWAKLSESGTSLGGIMFDSIGPNHRQGTAIFNESFIKDPPSGDPNPTAWVERMKFWTAVHEMGHSFNLAHSWQKSYGTQWRPLANEPEARSFMNYPYYVNGGQQAFFQNFKYAFSPNELEFMRHAPAKFVEMGNANWFDHHGFQAPHLEQPPALELTLRANRPRAVFEFMEPIVLELKLKNISDYRVTVGAHILSELDHMVAIIKKDGQPARQYRPYEHSCFDPTQIVLEKGVSLYESLFLSAGTNGWDLAEPGNYTLQLGLKLDHDAPMLVSNPLRLQIMIPGSRDEERLAQDYFSDDVGRIIAFDGSHYLTSGNDVLKEVSHRMSGSKAAAHAKIALARAIARDYKDVDFETNEVKVSPPDPKEARAYFEDALIKDGDGAAESLGHVDFKYYVDIFTDWLDELGEGKKAAQTQANMHKVLEARGVKTTVLDEIKQRETDLLKNQKS